MASATTTSTHRVLHARHRLIDRAATFLRIDKDALFKAINALILLDVENFITPRGQTSLLEPVSDRVACQVPLHGILKPVLVIELHLLDRHGK